ncbi:MAG: copper chaperone PCu(A)C [Burkholderiaceae bacterium]|nr:copper chaperone PCu(A)C [Burkholderiaceae bacterium]
MRNFWLTIGGVLLAAAAWAHGHGVKAGDLTVEEPWARATVGGQANGAAYLKIRNAGATDKLLSASAPVASVVELHTHVMDGNVMRMRKVEAIDITGGAVTELKPGGLHVMLIGLKAPLKAGEKFPLTLKFERAGEVKVDVEVRTAAPTGGAHKH